MADSRGSGRGTLQKSSKTILVSGLGQVARKTDLQGAFGDFGQIIRIDLQPGKAYLEFEDWRDAEEAVSAMDGKSVKGNRIRVEVKQTTETPVARQHRQGRETLEQSRGGSSRRSRSRSRRDSGSP
mmetsp:Transcript_1316/g.3208  ORF Transcript_1316/g.3208 Transcript_1316/m.3208 type:complete len:126 (-) Transcript_1316:148-525(-)